MLVSEIRVQAQLDTSRVIDELYTVNYVNEGMRKLAMNFAYAGVEETVDIEVTDIYSFYALPDKTLSVKSIYRDNLKYTGRVRVDGTEIQIPEKGTFSVTVRKFPTNVTADTSTPEIPLPFHDALAKWVAYKERSRIFTDSDPTAQQFLNDFWGSARDVNVMMKRRNRQIKKIRAPQY